MNRRRAMRMLGGPTPRLLLAAAILLVCGLTIDLGSTRRLVEAKRQLLSSRNEHSLQLLGFKKRDRQVRELTQTLGAADLAQAVESFRAEDPVTMLSRAVSASGLVGRELVTEQTSEDGGLRRTRFFVRAFGSYREVMDLVRRLEEGREIVTVDALAIQQQGEGGALEARLNVSVYTP